MYTGKRPAEDDSNKGFEIYMPGKDIGHINIEYTCSVRILNTYREHMSGKDIRHTLERDRLKTTLTKVSKIYMPGKDIGHIKIEYTCSVRILNTYKEHISGKDIRHTQEGDRLEQTHWGGDIWNGKIVDRRRIHEEKRPTQKRLWQGLLSYVGL